MWGYVLFFAVNEIFTLKNLAMKNNKEPKYLELR